MPATVSLRFNNLWEMLEHRVRASQQPQLSVGGEQMEWDELLATARRSAVVLADLGVAKGSRVATFGETRADLLAVSLGLTCLGAVEVPFNTALNGTFLERQLQSSGVSFLVVVASYLASVVPALRESRVTTVIVVDDSPADRSLTGVRVVSLSSLVARADAQDAVPATVCPDDPALVIYTSGTTGPSKGVVLSHGYFLHHSMRKQADFDLGPDDVLYSCLPLFHINARLVTLYAAMNSGAGVVLDSRFSASNFWSRLRETRTTVFTFLGTMAGILLERPAHPDESAHTARLAFGSPIPVGRYEEFCDRFRVKVSNTFGMTESMGVIFNPPDDFVQGSLGKEIAEFSLRVVSVDDPSRTCEVDEVGELLFRPQLPYLFMSEYLDNPAATVKAWQDLWFHTGDLVHVNSDGNYFLHGRATESIRRKGENISAWEVESVVTTHPSVEECAMVGVPSTLGEDDMKIVVVATTGAEDISISALHAEIDRLLPRHAHPRYLEVVAALPKTPTMRVMKHVLGRDWRTPTTWDSDVGSFLDQPADASASRDHNDANE